ncbi:DUF4956 domain-containing protein [Parvicella tangerina]|uniref:DUF4956 domain-containing protein n=1 Tax=Parvicella tangerina TaxID=2829795 RepID=A0A916JMY0_9FLAO|nr:DUF4956 domain-containing protein [Parvicella tangerina]CAG5082664.1 hypothetical protein CRYO30217_01977 [Parvicella tangerina]
MQLRLLLLILVFIPLISFGQANSETESFEDEATEETFDTNDDAEEKDKKKNKEKVEEDEEETSFGDLTFQKIKLYDNDFEKLLLRFLLNLTFTLILVRALYFPTTQRKDYLFSFIITNIVVFMIIFAMKKYDIGTGIGLGLFAVFGIIRFRTTTMPVREMTYLFMVIGIAVLNALASKKFSWAELAFANLVIVGATFVIERMWLLEHEAKLNVTYEKIDLIKPGRMDDLLADLNERTGLVINRVEIGKINFLNDTVRISIYYYKDQQTSPIYMDENDDSDGN